MKLSFLVDNKTEKSNCKAEWGLAMLVESGGHKVLFDTGASPMFIENAKAMKVELSDVEAVCISHGHYDHTGGTEAFTGINSTAPIYVHRNAFYKTFGTDAEGNIDEHSCGIKWSEEFKESIEERLILTENVVNINDNMTLIGNIPDMDEYPPAENFYREVKSSDDDETGGDFEVSCYVPDDMSHEQFLVVTEGEKIYIISGCCHRGMIPTIRTAQKHFPGKQIAAVAAGMHLYPLGRDERHKVVEEIAKLDIEKLFPVHCTGMEAIMEFKALMGDNCIAAASGDIYEC